MKLTTYERVSTSVSSTYKLVMLSDVHNVPFDDIIAQVAGEKPDAILVVGDIVDRHRKTYKRALPFLKACADTAPTFFSYGNHEIKFPKLQPEEITATGVVLLDNDFIRFGDLVIGGHTPYTHFDWLADFERQDGYKILMNHHPEYYIKEPDGRKAFTTNPGLRNHEDIDLILSGHAHGGQWRFFSRGVLAPGQGLMAKYVRGTYGNMIVDMGAGATDIAVLSMGDVVVASCVPLGGDAFDDAIIRYLRKKHNLLVGERTAENIKIDLGSAVQPAEPIEMEVTGRNLVSGLPKSQMISSLEIYEALHDTVGDLIEALEAVIERTPPQLTSDIFEEGIVLSGGAAQLSGLADAIYQVLDIPCGVADDPQTSIVMGCGQALEDTAAMREYLSDGRHHWSR